MNPDRKEFGMNGCGIFSEKSQDSIPRRGNAKTVAITARIENDRERLVQRNALGLFRKVIWFTPVVWGKIDNPLNGLFNRDIPMVIAMAPQSHDHFLPFFDRSIPLAGTKFILLAVFFNLSPPDVQGIPFRGVFGYS